MRLSLALLDTKKQFSKVAEPIYTPTKNFCESGLLHILADAGCCESLILVFLVVVRWYLSLILICISFASNGVHRLFMCLLAN